MPHHWKLGFSKLALLALVPLAVYFSFGLYHLTDFSTADEHYWYYNSTSRIFQYWDAIKNENWIATRINTKPGVTLAYVSGIGTIFEKTPDTRMTLKGSGYTVNDPDRMKEVNLAFRLPLLIFNGLFGLVLMWLIGKLTGKIWLGLLAGSLILLSPIIIGISQIVNPDSMLWEFSVASILSFLIYLKDDKWKYAFLTGFFLALSFLSKYAAIILVPFFILTLAIEFYYGFEQWNKDGVLHKKARRFIAGYFLILAVAAAVFSLLMPAVFVDPSILYQGTIGFKKTSPLLAFLGLFLFVALIFLDAGIRKSRFLLLFLSKTKKIFMALVPFVSALIALSFLAVFLNYALDNKPFVIKDVPFNAGRDKIFFSKSIMTKIFLELYPIIFSLTPIVFFSALFAWIKGISNPFSEKKLVFILSAFIISFYAGVLQQKLLISIRYGVMLYPIISILAAIGIYELFDWEKLRSRWRIAIYVGAIAISSISLWLIKPFYFNYTNDMLPKSRIITGAWGYGGYEAAEYLNALPDSDKLVVWTDYWGFCPFFRGTCIKSTGIKKKSLIESGMNIDYYVVTRSGIESDFAGIWKNIRKMDDTDAAWHLAIDGREGNSVDVYSSKYNIFEIMKAASVDSEEAQSSGGDESDTGIE
ncbi:MAG: phospholipid carrier-dependent glycosyltransferase [Candidatus Moranbacteria bacterium]|nr:phospholipid carrier-dependent glycosyltransferase [Candidatus Moranbacteria bacterium]